jgi:hypothetical protein
MFPKPPGEMEGKRAGMVPGAWPEHTPAPEMGASGQDRGQRLPLLVLRTGGDIVRWKGEQVAEEDLEWADG